MNLTVSNGSNGDGHANIMKKHILKVNPNYVFALSCDLEPKNESERKEYLQTPDQDLLCICKQENEEEDAKVDWKL